MPTPPDNPDRLNALLPDGRVQARALRAQARAGGLRFEAYLPSGLADWLLDMIEGGVFRDPSEAVFVILSEHQDLEPHPDLREEMLRRRIQAAINDPRPAVSAEELDEQMRQKSTASSPEPAVWQKAWPDEAH